MCLVVYCNGYREAKGNYLTILVSVLKGKYDNHLEWPLNCTVSIELSDDSSYMVRALVCNTPLKLSHRIVFMKIANCLNFQYICGTKILKFDWLKSK